MIVRCPGCQARYRVETPLSAASHCGRCSRCSGLVPLVALRPGYVVRGVTGSGPLVPPAGRLPIGMDDPALADRIRGRGVVDGTAMTYRIELEPSIGGAATLAADAAPPEAPFGATLDAEDFGPADEFAARAAMEMDGDAEALGVDVAPAIAAEPEGLTEIAPAEFRPSVGPKPRRRPAARVPRSAGPCRPRALPQILGSVFFAVLGTAAGYYANSYRWVEPVRIHPLVEPIDPVLLGGLLGLLIGWVAVRWTARRV